MNTVSTSFVTPPRRSLNDNRFGKVIHLAYPTRVVAVRSLADAYQQLTSNDWPPGSPVVWAHARNAVDLAQRHILDGTKARKIFLEAARAAGLI